MDLTDSLRLFLSHPLMQVGNAFKQVREYICPALSAAVVCIIQTPSASHLYSDARPWVHVGVGPGSLDV